METIDGLRYDQRDGVATITLNRPDNRNALSVGLINSFGAHLDAASAEERRLVEAYAEGLAPQRAVARSKRAAEQEAA